MAKMKMTWKQISSDRAVGRMWFSNGYFIFGHQYRTTDGRYGERFVVQSPNREKLGERAYLRDAKKMAQEHFDQK